MKIKSLMLNNFAKVTEIKVNFSDSITYICGGNGSGKSTIGLNAIWFIIKGLAQKGVDVLHAERFRFIGPIGKSAKGTLEIHDEKEGVTHTVTRKLLKDKAPLLEIKSSDGIERGEDFLDSLFSAVLINPFRFSELTGKEQALLLGIDTSEFDTKRKVLKEERTAIYQDVKRLEGVAEASMGAEEVEEVSIKALLQERKEAEDFNTMVAEKSEEYQDLQSQKQDLEKEIHDLRNQLQVAEFNLTKITNDLADFELPPEPIILAGIEKKIADAEGTNEKARAYKQSMEDQKAATAIRAKYEAKAEEIRGLDRERTKYIQAQKLPFSNITINEDGELLLNDKPFCTPYFSTGELLKFGAKLGAKIASNQGRKLDYVWIPDCQNLDEKNRESLFADLVKQGFQVVAEYVDTKKQEKGYSILLKEMKVVGDDTKAGPELT